MQSVLCSGQCMTAEIDSQGARHRARERKGYGPHTTTVREGHHKPDGFRSGGADTEDQAGARPTHQPARVPQDRPEHRAINHDQLFGIRMECFASVYVQLTQTCAYERLPRILLMYCAASPNNVLSVPQISASAAGRGPALERHSFHKGWESDSL